MVGGKLFEKSFPNAFSQRRPPLQKLLGCYSNPSRPEPARLPKSLQNGRAPSRAFRPWRLQPLRPKKSLWKGVRLSEKALGKAFLQTCPPHSYGRREGFPRHKGRLRRRP